MVKYLDKRMLSRLMLLAMLFLLVSSVTPTTGFVAADDDGTTTEDDDDTTETHDDSDDDDEHEIEHYRDSDSTVWIETDIMTVTLSPDIPSYQYWYSADANGSHARFMVSYLMIVEFDDNNSDGVYQPNETIAFAPLDAFNWALQTGSITDELGNVLEVYASYTKGGLSSEWEDDWFEDWMPGYEQEDHEEGSALQASDDDYNFSKFESMTLQFYGHVYRTDVVGNITDDAGVQANYTVEGGVELKVDIEIGNFPFESSTSKVTVLNYLREDLSSDDSDHHYLLHEEDGEDEIDSEDETEYGVEFDEHDEDDDGVSDYVQELSLVDSTSNVTRGFYRWLDKAVVTHLNGSKTAVDVEASYWTGGDGLLLFLAYPNFDGGSILHDPSMRLIETGSPVGSSPGLFGVPLQTLSLIGIAAAAIVLIGIAAKRR